MSIQDYIAAQRANIFSIGQLPRFSVLGDLTDRLYERAMAYLLKPPTSRRFFLWLKMG